MPENQNLESGPRVKGKEIGHISGMGGKQFFFFFFSCSFPYYGDEEAKRGKCYVAVVVLR